MINILVHRELPSVCTLVSGKVNRFRRHCGHIVIDDDICNDCGCARARQMKFSILSLFVPFIFVNYNFTALGS